MEVPTWQKGVPPGKRRARSRRTTWQKSRPCGFGINSKLETLKPWVCNSKGERRGTVNDHYTVGSVRVFTVFEDSLVVSMYFRTAARLA